LFVFIVYDDQLVRLSGIVSTAGKLLWDMLDVFKRERGSLVTPPTKTVIESSGRLEGCYLPSELLEE